MPSTPDTTAPDGGIIGAPGTQPPTTAPGEDGTSPLPGQGTQSDGPAAPPPDDGVIEDPPDTCWEWWLKYWWLVPLLLLLLLLFGLLYKLLKWLGFLKLFAEFLAALWELIRNFLKGGIPRPPSAPELPAPPTAEPPEEQPPEEEADDPRDEDEDCTGSCDVVGTPVVTLEPRGFFVLRPDCDPGLVQLVSPFSVDARFSGNCCCCWYKQEIKGYVHVRRRGTNYWEDVGIRLFGGGSLDPDNYQQDSTPSFPGYGHRYGRINIPDDQYLPRRRNGCWYHAGDMPSVRNLSLGDRVVINLWFRGAVIDMCTGQIKWQQEWQLRTRGHIGLEMSFPYLDSTYTYEKLY